MADSESYSVILLSLYAGASGGVYITNSIEDIDYGGNTYVTMPALEVDFPPVSGSLDAPDCKIKGLTIQGSFLTELSNHAPFSSIEVHILDATIDLATGAVSSVSYPFSGLVYQAVPMPLIGTMDIICKDWKYYMDITAGMPCTEQCAWQYLGGKGCGVSVHSEPQVVDSVSGLSLVVDGPLADTTTLLFNKGYVEYEGMRIKIKYHSSGLSFQMSKAPPSDWVGKTVTLYAGCDRSLNTCKNIHNNEANFLGLGYAMVDYNALYENP